MADPRRYRHRTAESSVQSDWVIEAYDPDGESNVKKQIPVSVLQSHSLGSVDSLFINELTNAEADVAGDGQFWVRDDTPNVPMFTDDTGVDRRLDLQSFVIACSDETTDLATATPAATFRMPYAFKVTEVRASVTTAPVDATIEVDINEGGTTILSTVISIDSTEKTSTTAATPAVISDADLADDAEITIDIDQVGSTTAGAGLKVTLIGYAV